MNSNFIENVHYYFDHSLGTKGAIVFTEEYHLQRGCCCGNGCRHCPYDPVHKKGNKTVTEKQKDKGTN